MKNIKTGTKITLVAIASVLVAVIAFLTILVCNNRIYNGVSAAGINLGGKTLAQAEVAMKESEFFDTLPEFYCGDVKFNIAPEDIDLDCDAKKTAQLAYQYGRDTNVFVRLGNIFETMFNPVDLPIAVEYDKDKLESVFEEHISELRTPSVEPIIEKVEDKIYITNGSQGLDVDMKKFDADLAAVATGNEERIELVIETINPTPISAKSLHEEYATPAKNAEYTISDMRISFVESVDGVDFDIAEAEKIISDNAKNSKKYFIPLTITPPEMTTEQLNNSLFGDQLGTYTTKYNPGEIGRTKNVTLAARKIHNIVLKQGDEFSYNNIVGERTVERGFSNAKVYAGGDVVDGLGGGICQVSSTLYNAILYADLEVVSRTSHSLPVTYVPLGRDATVAFGSIDFKFKNPYETPVKIVSSIGGGTLTVSVYGKKSSDKKVEIYTERVSTIPFSTREVPDETLLEGQTKVDQAGSNGAVVNTYKKVTEDGNVTFNGFIHKSVYNPITKVMLVPPTPETEGEIPSDENTPEETTPDESEPTIEIPPEFADTTPPSAETSTEDSDIEDEPSVNASAPADETAKDADADKDDTHVSESTENE